MIAGRRPDLVLLNRGDHVCAIYHGEQELADIVADFLAAGLRKSERCWYLPASDDSDTMRAALKARRIDTKGALERGALRILSSNAAYRVRGDFDPEDVGKRYSPNAFYDCGVHSLRAADPAVVASKLGQLKTVAADFNDRPPQRDGLRRSR